jgi:hypothetical protein
MLDVAIQDGGELRFVVGCRSGRRTALEKSPRTPGAIEKPDRTFVKSDRHRINRFLAANLRFRVGNR